MARKPVAAQTYPTKTISIVIPLGAGGSMDVITRTIAEQLTKRLGQPVIIENRPGGGMVIGASAVASAPADGYTLMNAPSGAYAINPTLFKQLSYDPEKDFVPVALYTRIPFVLVVNPALPVNSVKELIKYATDNPGQLSYAASGRGGMIHLAGEMFRHAAKINMTSVPHRQGGPASLNDVVAGHVPVTFADPGVAQGVIAGGKVRALGVTSLKTHAKPAGRADPGRSRRAGLRSGVVAPDRRAGEDAERHRRQAQRRDQSGCGDARSARPDAQNGADAGRYAFCR